MMQYIDKILLPYVKRKKEELHLQCNHPALVIFDNFTGQNTEQLLKLLEKTAFILCKYQQTVQTGCSHLMSV